MKKTKVSDWIAFVCLVIGIAAYVVYAIVFQIFSIPDEIFWLTLCNFFELFMLGIALFPFSTIWVKKLGVSFAVVLSIVSGIFHLDFDFDLPIWVWGLYVVTSRWTDDGPDLVFVDSVPLFILFRIAFGGILLFAFAFLKKRNFLSAVGFSGWFIVRWVNLVINSVIFYSNYLKGSFLYWSIIVVISLLFFFVPRYIAFLKKIKMEKRMTRQKDLPPEERLKILQEYAEKGCIDSETYEKKRQEILDSL